MKPIQRNLPGLVAVLLLVCGSIADAQQQQPQPPQRQPSAAPTQLLLTIARSDVAAAYLRFDHAYQAHPPADGEARAAINRAFDAATIMYFTNRTADAIRSVNELTARLEHPDSPGSASEALIRSLQVRVAPPVARRDRPSIIRIRVAPMYDVNYEVPVEVRLVIRPDEKDSKPVIDQVIRLEPRSPPVTITRNQPELKMGRHVIDIVGPDGTVYPQGQWTVVEVPLDVARLNNERRLHDVRPENDEMRYALVAASSRNALLSDRVDENNLAVYASNLFALSRDVQSEVEWLAMDKDPYANKEGDQWRSLLAAGMQIPTRIYAPPDAIKRGAAMPLVIALSEAGGDENMFSFGYGAGQLAALAEKHGFVLLTPATSWTLPNASALQTFIDATALQYKIDKSRVYLIGHALGATVACAMASRAPDKFAGVALFSEASFKDAAKFPKAVVYVGELDPITPAQQTKDAVDLARRAGIDVTLRSFPDRGHTLLVNDLLPDAIERWFGK